MSAAKKAKTKAKTTNVVKAQTEAKSPLNIVWWLFTVILVAAGLWANYHFQSAVALPLRIIAWIVLTIVVFAVLSLTSQGRKAFGFFKKSRVEMSKVVWPSRQETIQTTLIVLVLVAVLAVIIWGLDTFLFWLIGWLTGQRG